MSLIDNLKELRRLRDEMTITISNEYNKFIRVEAEISPYNKIHFNIRGENFETKIPLEQMKRFAEWLDNIGIFEED